jgi:putative hydrolase of the HAD superfamily
MPRAVLFDLFNTLVSGGNATRWAVTREMGTDVGVDPDEYAKLFAELWVERMTGDLGDLPTQIRTIASRLGPEPSEAAVELAVRRRMELARSTIVPGAESLRVLSTLRAAGFRVAIVSNCTIDSAEVIHTTSLARAADAVVLSCDVGLAKPEPAIYLLACEQIGVPDPTECVFVGDGADTELRGAKRLGMRVIQTTQFSRNDPLWPGERIEKLSDLLPLLGIHDDSLTDQRHY